MKNSIALILGILLCLCTRAQQTTAPAEKGAQYGAPVAASGAISVQELDKVANSQFKGKVKGKITDVCMQKGCWMKMEKENGEKMMIKFTDYAFFMPKDIVGKEVVIEGTADIKEVSVQQQKHYAEDAHKSKTEIDKIIEPKKEMQFTANGVLVI